MNERVDGGAFFCGADSAATGAAMFIRGVEGIWGQVLSHLPFWRGAHDPQRVVRYKKFSFLNLNKKFGAEKNVY